MNFDLPPEDDQRRVEVRAWFEQHPEPTGQEWLAAGYTAPHWPEPWGISADAEMQLIIDSEIERAGLIKPSLVNAIAINNCGQSLLTHGTPEQQERFLKPALALEEIWCMLFSEPSCGSDLAGIHTTARREGDEYVVNGQKIWTSLAHESDVGVLVARTDASLPKHRGLSQFLVDMDSPGITVRPIIDMSGYENEYNEVFLEDVRVPADRLLGQEGDGFALSMVQLQTERVALSKPGAIWGSGPSARDMLNGLAEEGMLDDAVVRDEAARVYIEGEIMRLLTYRSLTDRINAKTAGPEGAVHKMIAAPHGQEVVDLIKRSEGVDGMLTGHQPFGRSTDDFKDRFDNWDYAYWFNPAVTLGVGTQEILKNVVAESILGLPRDADPTARQPFSQASK